VCLIFDRQSAGSESSLTHVLRNRIPAGEVNTHHIQEEVEKVY
jgi:hypothetical protein